MVGALESTPETPVRRARSLADVEAFHPRPVRADVRPVLPIREQTRDRDRDTSLPTRQEADCRKPAGTVEPDAVDRTPERGRTCAELLTVDEALARILEHARPLALPRPCHSKVLPGRILAEPARAVVDLPPFPSSAMDGYAVRAEDTPGVLPVAVRVAAGSPAAGSARAGTAAAIATGESSPKAPTRSCRSRTPSNATGTSRSPSGLRPAPTFALGAATSVQETSSRTQAARLGAAQIGALAAAGVAEVRCARRPRVAVLATGSELRSPGDPLAPGEIYESNRQMIAAALRRTGAEIDVLPAVADDDSSHRDALERGLDGRRPRHLGRGLDGTARSRAADRVGARRRGALLGSCGQAGQAAVVRRSGRHARLRASGKPRLIARRVLRLRRAGAARAPGSRRAGPRRTTPAGRVRRCVATRTGTSSFERARRWTTRALSSQPVSGQESHMVVRAASADVLVHVPRGRGRDRRRLSRPLPVARVARVRAVRHELDRAPDRPRTAAARHLPRTVRSDRARAPRAERRPQPMRVRTARTSTRCSRSWRARRDRETCERGSGRLRTPGSRARGAVPRSPTPNSVTRAQHASEAEARSTRTAMGARTRARTASRGR